MKQVHKQALDILAKGGVSLTQRWHFTWPAAIQQALCRLRLWDDAREAPILVAVMGGASSGKSTVFNNLLDGHLASRITARGHATRGPILAVHEEQRSLVDRLLAEDRLFPGLRRVAVELDANVEGEPDAVALFYHTVDTLRDVLLCDMPDLTSQASAQEGEVALTFLPWFDRLIVVVDHERWFDRQTVSELRAASVRFGQERFVLFNRTREEALAQEDEVTLRGQAERLAAQGMEVLGFRHGRGFCQFAPGTLDEVAGFLQAETPPRDPILLSQVAEAANRCLNQNTERNAGLVKLRDSLQAAMSRSQPTAWDCMVALMAPEERKQLEVVSRVFGMQETRHWLANQTQRLQKALKNVPLLGMLVPRVRSEKPSEMEATDRVSLARGFYESGARRQVHEIQHLVRASEFWHELQRWAGLTPAARRFAWTPSSEQAVGEAAAAYDTALNLWTEKIKQECQGINPKIHGAVGAGVIALAVVLVAVPGPVTALTFLTVKAALGTALTELVAATGAGALLGSSIRQLTSVIQEKLVGSPEFEAVKNSAAVLCDLLKDAGRASMGVVLEEAERYCLPSDDPLAQALETLRYETEVDHG